LSFNSIVFILLFLPISVLGYYALSLTPLHRLRLPFLITVSLLFYGRAQASYVPLLLVSVIANYLAAVMIVRNTDHERAKRFWLALGVIANAGALISLKYLSAVVGTITGVFGHDNPIGGIVAPLAISFYTFQQISFLVDVARGKVELEGIVRYMSFVAFFPTLLAGPITLYSEIGPQLGIRPQRRGVAQNLLIGLTIFSLGLFKKTVIADTIGLWSDPVFAAAHQGSSPGFFLGWGTAIAYALQIYFDFSGYSDMAIGVARMLGIVLPLNFFSPFRSTSISELWRRWHMTLSRFVRVYIYQPISIPLTRFASLQDYGKWPTMAVSVFLPAFVSMLIIGAWHGPNWTYLVFGAMQGAFIVTDEVHGALTRKRRRKKPDTRFAVFCYGLLTFLAFASSSVPFRSETMQDALRIFAGMAGLHGLGLTHNWPAFLAPNGGAVMLLLLVFGLLIVYLLPNTEQIMDRVHPALEWEKWRVVDPARFRFTFAFTPTQISLASLALFLGFAFISRGSAKFIYFKF
jgi:alginate O-acetyltransferase complex protein AlgI